MIAEPEIQDAPGSTAAPLDVVIGYRNDLVIHGFTKRFMIAPPEAETIFVEMLRWLWYMASTEPTDDNPEAHEIDDPLLIIDEMWHEFILVTRDYTQFCDRMFGRYIHHRPNSGNDQPRDLKGSADVKSALAALLGRKRAKYEAVYDVLGKDVFITWYQTFPRKYDHQAMSALRRR